MVMNLSHTGFKDWNTQKQLVKPLSFTDEDMQVELPLDTIKFNITPNTKFIGILQPDEEEEGGDQAKEET
jgi:hypothetical protein